MAVQKVSDLQLAFDLQLDEVEEDAAERAVSWMEAQQISEAARRAFELRSDEQAGWYGEYLRLVERGWPWRVATYIAWASSPKKERWPETLHDLATKVLGLTGPRQIHVWRKKYPTIDAVVSMLQAAPLFEHRRDVIEALIASATDPNYKSHNDRKLFLEMIGDYVPKSKLEVNRSGKADDIAEKSDDELRAWLGEVNGSENGLERMEDDPEDGDEGPSPEETYPADASHRHPSLKGRGEEGSEVSDA